MDDKIIDDFEGRVRSAEPDYNDLFDEEMEQIDQNTLLKSIILLIETPPETPQFEIGGSVDQVSSYISELKNKLQKLTIETIDVESVDQLLQILLTIATKSNNTICVPLILTRWSQLITGFDEYEGPVYPILPSLFRDNRFPTSLLNFIHQSIKEDVSLVEIAIDIFEGDGGPQTIYGLERLFSIFGRPDGATYRFLYSEALDSRNDAALDYISSFQKFYQEPAKKPDWVINPKGDDDEPLYEERELLDVAEQIANEIMPTDIDDNIDDIEFLTEYLTNGLNYIGLEIDTENKKNTMLKLRKLLESKSPEERKLLLSSFETQERNDKLNSDQQLFYILGPSNPIVGTILIDRSNYCFKFGGCRMYFCNCFDNNKYQDEFKNIPYYPNIPTWFQGICDNCGKEILKRIHSVRRPLPGGGWLGCFCSFDCLKNFDNKSVLDDEMSKILLRRTEDDLRNVTVWDRYELDIEEELKNAIKENPSGYIPSYESYDKMAFQLNEKNEEEDTSPSYVTGINIKK
jgi:hypothetical protein